MPGLGTEQAVKIRHLWQITLTINKRQKIRSGCITPG